MIHQPSGGTQGQATTLEIYTKEIVTLRSKLNEILVKHTHQNIKRISKDTDRDFFMSAEEAKEYGIVDSHPRLEKRAETVKRAARGAGMSSI